LTQFLSNFDQKVEPTETYVDPVSKIRVSTPENLIDTDFEYGLQGTKWETVELVNNIPSFYVSDSDRPLSTVSAVTAVAGSDIIEVTTVAAHGLLAGSPIDVRGLSSRTGEGKFLIKTVPSPTTFTYIANGLQTFNGNVGNIYTTITPGNFYSGSQIPYRKDIGVNSDTFTPSKITVETPYEHGHIIGSNIYLVNTFGTKEITMANTLSNAPDLRPFVDFEDTIVRGFSPTNSQTETKQMRSTYYRKIAAADVDVTANTVSWPANELRNGDCLLYIPPSGDVAIGGMARFQIYYVVGRSATTIQLSLTRGGAAVNFTTTGSYNFGKAGLHLVYEIGAMERTNTQTRLFHRFSQVGGDTSGWDWASTNWGLGRTQPAKMALIARNGATVDTRITNRYYSTAVNTLMVMPETATTPGLFNFIEDFERYSQSATFSPSVFAQNNNGLYFTDTAPFTVPATPFAVTGSTYFFVPLVFDEERDSFFSANHGLTNGQQIELTIDAGADILRSASSNVFTNTNANVVLPATAYTAEVLSPDRFRLVNNRIVQATGTYTFAAFIDNSLNNSFYYPDHGYNGGETVTVRAGVPGTLPSTTTGAVVIDAKTSSGNLRGAWTVLNNFMNSYTSTLANHRNVVLNGFENSNIFIGSGVATGTSGITSTFYESVLMSEDGFGEVSAGNLYLNKQEPGIIADAAAGTILARRDFSFTGTKWLQNTAIPHYSTLFATDATLASKRFETFLKTNFAGTSASYSFNNRSYTVGSNANWRATANFAWSTVSSATNMVQFEVVLWNESWNEAFTNSFTANAGSGTTIRSITGTDNKKYVRFISTFMVQSNTPMTNANADTLISNLVTDFANSFIQPTLTQNSQQVVRVLNKDRFYLENPTTFLEVDIEDGGLPSIIFTQAGIQGVLDGAYPISEIPSESSFKFSVPFYAAETDVPLDATTVTNNLIRVNAGHNFIPGTRVRYFNNGLTTITGLTSDQSYYVFVKDEFWVGFANTYEDALRGNLVSISAGSGSHSLFIKTVNGRSAGAGTIDVVRGNRNIAGTGTLFKRYFKVGDSIGIKNSTTTPGSIENFVIATIADDTTMQLTSEPNFDSNDTKYFIETKIYMRPDGYSTHRPFDGGVEIAAGSSPNSQIIRQTRKYFRYQSGKGIQTSLAINFNPPIHLETIFSSGLTATAKTRYPHRLTANSNITISGSTDPVYNGNFAVASLVDDFTFTYTLPTTPTTTLPGGIIQFNMNGYSGSYTRGGMFDTQNGFFFEFDGADLWCVRRSSTQQISGKVSVFNNESLVVGTDTNFRGQLVEGDMLVIRGGSYRIVKIRSNTELVVSPQYKGTTATDVIVTKTVDTKVKQSNWSIDPCDGTGPSGYDIDLDKIQMAYMDYSWYGAGKIRYGFKDTFGRVKYVHEFVHNNQLDEAYMRSGNLPARYEIENSASFTYSPTLFHWGTSVIMDGGYDDDGAYLFTSTSNNLSFTNGATLSATTNAASVLTNTRIPNSNLRTYRIQLQFPVADASKFSAGTPLYTVDGQLNGETVEYTNISGANVQVFILLGDYVTAPVAYPVIASNVAISIGAPANDPTAFNLGTDEIPLVTIRLAPSVDSGLSGELGVREIINRMQLKLNEIGLILTHDCEVSLVLNPDLSNVLWENVSAPSLSQLIKHNAGDRVVGGTKVFSFRASGGTSDNTGNRLSNTSNFNLGDLINMGNSILGGNGVFPNGPDILTVVVKVVNTSGINATNKFVASGRITWSESQA